MIPEAPDYAPIQAKVAARERPPASGGRAEELLASANLRSVFFFGQMQMTRRNWYRFRMRPDASGCVPDASGCVGMRRDFEFQQISANSGKI